MVIRKAEKTDIPALVRLRVAMRNEREGQGDAQALSAALEAWMRAHADDPAAATFLAEEEGRIAATASMTVSTIMPSYCRLNDTRAYIYNVYTDPAFRHRGLAAAVVSALLDEARALGCTVAELNASPAGHPVYLKLGFGELSGEMSLGL